MSALGASRSRGEEGEKVSGEPKKQLASDLLSNSLNWTISFANSGRSWRSVLWRWYNRGLWTGGQEVKWEAGVPSHTKNGGRGSVKVYVLNTDAFSLLSQLNLRTQAASVNSTRREAASVFSREFNQHRREDLKTWT